MTIRLLSALLLLARVCQATLTSDEIHIFRDNGVDVIAKDDVTWTLEHHGVPDHGFEGGFGNNPNTPSAQNYSFDIPKYAVEAEEKGCVKLGPIGLSISGATFFNPYTIDGRNAVEGDCVETFDDCSGHPAPGGVYHYHQHPACLYKGELRNKFLGVAFDGYPIYGPKDETGKDWTSQELDRCHGHVHNGRYIYRITLQFPYILGCYHGNVIPRDTGTGGQPRPHGTQETMRSPPPPPPGNNACSQVVPDWVDQTCYAFCHSPGNGSYDNCSPSSLVTSDDSNATNIIIFTPIALFLTCILSISLFSMLTICSRI